MARITIPDALLDIYAAHAQREGVDVEHAITAQLIAFQDVRPGERRLTLGGATLEAIENRLAVGQIRTVEQFVNAFAKLASVNFEAYTIRLSPGQLLELEHRAKREGRPVAEYLDRIWRDLNDLFFSSASAGRPAIQPPQNAAPWQAKATPGVNTAQGPAHAPKPAAAAVAAPKPAAPVRKPLPPPPTKDARATDGDEV